MGYHAESCGRCPRRVPLGSLGAFGSPFRSTLSGWSNPAGYGRRCRPPFTPWPPRRACAECGLAPAPAEPWRRGGTYLRVTMRKVLGVARGASTEKFVYLPWCPRAPREDRYCPEQFEILGASESEGSGFSNGLWRAESGVAQPIVGARRVYKRIFIWRRSEE